MTPPHSGVVTPLTDFARLYREHAADVHRFAVYLSGDPPLADDLVSEAFVRVWTARERVELTTVRGYREKRAATRARWWKNGFARTRNWRDR